MAYVKIIYQNSPSTATPINAQNLNHMDDGIAENDRRLNELETAGVVNKFNGRSGNITPTKGDYDIADIGATDGQDGYVPVWRNSGTEENPDWGFEMEQQGGSGHKILDADGNEMSHEDALQFADAFVSDDPINGKTVVENIKEVAPADYASTTDEGIIVSDDGEDAVIHPSSEDYAEVEADGSTSYTNILNLLYSKIDANKIRDNAYVEVKNTSETLVFAMYRYTASGIFVSYTKVGSSYPYMASFEIKSSASKFYQEYNGSVQDKSTDNVSEGTVRFYYGNKKAVVDLQTTGSRCLLSDGTSVQQALKIVTYTATSATTVPAKEMVQIDVTDVIPNGYIPIGASFERGSGGTNVVIMGCPFFDTAYSVWRVQFFNYYNSSVAIQPIVNIVCVKSGCYV